MPPKQNRGSGNGENGSERSRGRGGNRRGRGGGHRRNYNSGMDSATESETEGEYTAAPPTVRRSNGGGPKQAARADAPFTEQFLQTTLQAYQSGDTGFMKTLFMLAPQQIANTPIMLKLQTELATLGRIDPGYPARRANTLLGEDGQPLADQVAEYFLFLMDLDVASILRTEDIEDLEIWVALFKTFMLKTVNTLSSRNGALTVPGLKAMTRWFIEACKICDEAKNDPKQTHLNTAANITLRIFNACLADRGPDIGKRSGVLYMANLLMRLYYKLNQRKLIPTVHNNIAASVVPNEFRLFPKSEQSTYFYYIGRHDFFQENFAAAMAQFDKAYYMVDPNDPMLIPQRKQFLIHLMACKMVLGEMPSDTLLARPEAADLSIFREIRGAIRTGNIRYFKRLMDENEDILCRWKIYTPIRDYCGDMAWRGLIRELHIIHKQQNPRANAYVLRFSLLQSIINDVLFPVDRNAPIDPYSIDNLDYSLLDTERLVSRLIAKGLILGNINRTYEAVVLPMKDAFPDVATAQKAEYSGKEVEKPMPGGVQKLGGVIRLSGLKPIGS